MIDISKERLCLLTEASEHIPGKPHYITLMRWKKEGVKGVILDTLMVGGRRYTSIEAIHRFITQLSAPTTNHSKAKADTNETGRGK